MVAGSYRSNRVMQQPLTTGEIMVFDKEARELFIVRGDVDLPKNDEELLEAVRSEQLGASYFDREALLRLQDAFKHIVLLEA